MFSMVAWLVSVSRFCAVGVGISLAKTSYQEVAAGADLREETPIKRAKVESEITLFIYYYIF